VPITNYMELTDDLCMTGFTLEQAQRMRCTLPAFPTAPRVHEQRQAVTRRGESVSRGATASAATKRACRRPCALRRA
jgi:hypothetical protein